MECMNTARLSKHHDSDSLKFRIKGYQNEVHETLRRIDKSLNVILRGRKVKSYTSDFIKQWNERTIILNRMVLDVKMYSENDMYKQMDKWLEGMSNDRKSEACQYMYDYIPHHLDELCGREIIEDYCRKRSITLDAHNN